jgi:hypothetical protein
MKSWKLLIPFKMDDKNIKEVHDAVSQSYWDGIKKRANKKIYRDAVKKLLKSISKK